MNYVKTVILDGMSVLFPLCLYLVYIAYIRSIDAKEGKVPFSIAILVSLFSLMYFDDLQNYNTNTFFSTPLLISYLSKRDKTAIIISIILMILYHQIHDVSIIVLACLYITYYLAYKYLEKKSNFVRNYSIVFCILKCIYATAILILVIRPNDIAHHFYFQILFGSIVLTVFSFLSFFFFIKSKKILEINTTFKELDKEKKLRASVFKLNHELKNPLAVCNGYLEMFPEASKKDQDKYIEIMQNEIKRSLTIINDFSSLGKIKNIEVEEIDICYLLEEIKEILEPLFKKNKAKIEIPDDEIYVEGDYNRLKQVFINLFKNSLESKRKEDLVVNVKIKEDNNNCIISMKDNGNGMSKETLEKIYNDFFTTKETGTGIGIPYIKEIIELHHGTLTYKSRENRGTTVLITLPKKQEKKS
ncbi:MAG: HAMP domain-containing sensor histidine kinase [Mollicutes bacterium]|nr:HAMP domain-containing sensor histidine kinase [Mollicutes bacterium]MDY5875324.1 HAMP domain-containing sensor histidine kinase [Bacilli bacterium]